MDGIHDLGGKQGLGALDTRDHGFHAGWERRVMGMTALLMAAGCWPVDAFRHAIERLDPMTYLGSGYWGRWLSAVESLVEEAGGRPQAGRVADPSAARDIRDPPRFRVGDAVRTRNLQRAGHTRLPGYARSKPGTVVMHHGAWVFPDTLAHDRGENPQHVYAVRFAGRELWGEEAEPATSVTLDLFESYLEPS